MGSLRCGRTTGLETVDLEVVFRHNAFSNKELTEPSPLVSLKLENLSVLCMLHNRAIASKNLLQRLEQLLPVQALRQALARSHPSQHTSVFTQDSTTSYNKGEERGGGRGGERGEGGDGEGTLFHEGM